MISIVISIVISIAAVIAATVVVAVMFLVISVVSVLSRLSIPIVIVIGCNDAAGRKENESGNGTATDDSPQCVHRFPPLRPAKMV